MKVARIRAGLYGVDAGNGNVWLLENKQSPAEWGGEWVWYATKSDSAVYLDPFYTKREALAAIASIDTNA